MSEPQTIGDYDDGAPAPRTWLIGEHNPYQARDAPEEELNHFALYPAPDASAGARLCRVLGLPPAEYLRRFERRNLLRELPWSAPRARAAADAVLAEMPERDRLVLLGRRVADAFGAPFDVDPRAALPVERWRGHLVLVLPHPSGRSHLWNDRALPERVRAALAALEAAP